MKPFEVLDSPDVTAIHDAALGVLKKSGYIVEHEAALKTLADTGARVDGWCYRLPRRSCRSSSCEAAQEGSEDLAYRPQTPGSPPGRQHVAGIG